MNFSEIDFAKEWIEAWNSHNLDRILEHYTDDFEITSPMIKISLGTETGTLKGKQTARNYWEKSFEKVPDLHFELIDVTKSIDSIAIYYKSVFNKKAIEVMFFDENGKINKIIAHYN